MSLSQSQDTNGPNQTQQDQPEDNIVVRHHYDFLVDLMSPEFGLVDKLYSNGTLTGLQMSEVEADPVIQKRNQILLRHIFEGNAGQDLIKALGESGQSHLVRYMEADGVYRPEIGGNWPLAEKESTFLKRNYEYLIDILDCSDLVGLLYQTNVLNKRQRDLILSSKWTTAEQNKVLLQILRKGSLDGYWQTIRCLHLSNQSHIAEIFETGGVIVRIDSNLQPETPNLTEMEKSIVAKVTNILRLTPHSEASRISEVTIMLLHPSVSDASRLWEEVQLNLAAVAAKHSVSLYFLCSNQGDVNNLEQMASDDQLKKFVEDLFTRLMEFPTRIRVVLKWSRDLFSKSRKHIEEIQAKNVIYKPLKPTIECLTLKILDTILQKAYLWSSLHSDVDQSKLSEDNKSSDIVLLGLVNALWFQRIQRRRFMKPILPQLQGIYRRKFEMHLNIIRNLHYLEEAIQVKDVKLSRRDLLASDLLTDLQIARHMRQITRKNKRRRRSGMLSTLAEEILPVKIGDEKTNINNIFIRFLHQTKLTNEAKVLEEGGATAKVEIRQPRNSQTDDWYKEFSRRINNLKVGKHLKSDDMATVIHNLEDSDLEILNSSVDRCVIVWIWYRSQKAVEALKALHNSQTLIDYLYRLVKANNRDRTSKDIHLEEPSQLKIDAMSLPSLVIHFDGKLQAEDAYNNPIGVTKLRNKIFLLDRSRSSSAPLHVLYVFNDQHPFRLRRKMKFEVIKQAICILSSEKNSCLYIADNKADCIWKIRLPDEDKIDDEKFTFTAQQCHGFPRDYDNSCRFRMTITNRGQILIIDVTDQCLLVYDSESDFDFPIRIALPDVIKRPLQVAENSAGNFIFLHRTLGRYSSGSEDQWVVSEVSQNGKTIIKQHVGTDNQWLDIFGEEAFLMVDRKDRIFLADTMNPRWILLNSSLQYVRSFILRKPIDKKIKGSCFLYPGKIFYDIDKNQIIVAGNKVIVFYREEDEGDRLLLSQKKFFGFGKKTIVSSGWDDVFVYSISRF